MPIMLFSKRQKLERGEVPDVYQYETIPRELRVQVIHILEESFGYNLSKLCSLLHKTLSREYGVFRLRGRHDSDVESVFNFLLDTEEAERVLDVIELSFHTIIDGLMRNEPYRFRESTLAPDDAIFELNFRFREHGVGYQYETGKIVRVDSQFVHSEVVRPALRMLSDQMYEGANAEFLNAHEHYRERRYKECLNDCLKAFESCLKAICKKRGWTYDDRDTAKRLIAVVLDNGLIPTYLQSHLSGLRSVLESGLPTVRNKLAGHGQGPEEIIVPDYIATYALHLTATNVLMLARADEDS